MCSEGGADGGCDEDDEEQSEGKLQMISCYLFAPLACILHGV